MSSPMSGSTSDLSPEDFAAVTPSVYSGSAWSLQARDCVDLVVGDVSALQPHRLARAHGQEQSVAHADQLSAPGWSRITRLSVNDDVAKASLDGTFVLIRPVTTSTEGRCVASTRWIPAARAFWVIRTIASSTSRGAVIIRSASSSTMAMM